MQGKIKLLFYKVLDYNKVIVEKLMLDVCIYPENLNESQPGITGHDSNSLLVVWQQLILSIGFFYSKLRW